MNGSDEYTEYDRYKEDISWAFHKLDDNYTIDYKILIAWRAVMKILDHIETKSRISDADKKDLRTIVEKLEQIDSPKR